MTNDEAKSEEVARDDNASDVENEIVFSTGDINVNLIVGQGEELLTVGSVHAVENEDDRNEGGKKKRRMKVAADAPWSERMWEGTIV
jgi:hypothetical protein